MDAVFNRDYAVVQGIVLFTSTAYIAINLLVDIAYALANPRHSNIRRGDMIGTRGNDAVEVEVQGSGPEGSKIRNRALRRFLRRPPAVVSLVFIILFVLVAIFAPQLAPYDPARTDFTAVRQAPSEAYILGTDEIGRDELSRVIFGARASLVAGVISVAIALILGIPLGLISGYYRGVVDEFIMRFTDALLSFPFLILAVALAAALGPSLTNAMIAIGIATTPTFIRLTRARYYPFKLRTTCKPLRLRGAGDVRILFKHVLPNSFAPLLVQATLTIAGAIIAESSLSF